MSDERHALLRMLKEGQRVVRSRTLSATAAANATPSTAIHRGGGGGGSRATKEPESTALPHLNAMDNLGEFLSHYYREFKAFAEDPMRHELALGRELNRYDRHVLHDLAQVCGLSHMSRGDDANRILVLQKDALFYGNPRQHESVNLEEIAERLRGKTSKYDLRRVHGSSRQGKDGAEPRPGELGSYADDDAVRKLERFRRATDEYRHASHMGYSQEEAVTMEKKGGHLEDILRGGDDGDDDARGARGDGVEAVGPSLLAKAQLRLQQQGDGKGREAGQATPSSSAANAPVMYSETCKGCGTRARLEGNRMKWQCLHYCARCTKSTIWVLEEDTGLVLTPRGGAVEAPSFGTASTRPAPTTADGAEGSGGPPPPLALEHSDDEEGGRGRGRGRLSIDRSGDDNGNDDDDEDDHSSLEEEELTVDDVVDSAAMNDFSDVDTNWVRRFAQRHRLNLRDHIVFCIEFADLMRAAVFRRHDADCMRPHEGRRAKRLRREPQPCLYAVVRGIGTGTTGTGTGDGDGDGGYVPVTALIDRVAAAVFAGGAAGSEEQDRLAVAFKNLSAYGTEATAVCQLRGVTMEAAGPSLEALTRELGSRHLFLTADLSQAIVKSSEG